MGTVAEAGTGRRAPADQALEERIRVLRRRVYGPDAQPEDVAALSEALADLRPVPAPEPEPVAPPSEDVAPAPTESPAPRARTALRAVPPRLVAGVVAVAVLGAAAGAGVAALAGAVAPPPAAAEPRFSAALAVRVDAAVLRRPARADDEPAALPGPELVGDSFRRLARYPAAGVTFWAAQDRAGDVCLVAADTYFRTACVDPQTFAATGAALTWSAGPGYPASTTIAYAAVWRHGRLTAGPAS